MDWKKSKIESFFSDRKQERIKKIIEGLLANSQAEENLYNGLFAEVFPPKKEMPVLWNTMRIDQKCDYLKIASIIIDAYQKIWHKHPEFIPMFVKNILRLMK